MNEIWYKNHFLSCHNIHPKGKQKDLDSGETLLRRTLNPILGVELEKVSEELRTDETRV